MAVHVYLENRPGGGLYNYRGELGATDDPQAFARLMLARGLRTVLRDNASPGIGRDIPAADLGVQS